MEIVSNMTIILFNGYVKLVSVLSDVCVCVCVCVVCVFVEKVCLAQTKIQIECWDVFWMTRAHKKTKNQKPKTKKQKTKPKGLPVYRHHFTNAVINGRMSMVELLSQFQTYNDLWLPRYMLGSRKNMKLLHVSYSCLLVCVCLCVFLCVYVGVCFAKNHFANCAILPKHKKNNSMTHVFQYWDIYLGPKQLPLKN